MGGRMRNGRRDRRRRGWRGLIESRCRASAPCLHQPSTINHHSLFRCRDGFTLIELLITLTLMTVISAGMALALGTALHTYSVVRRDSDIADARRMLAQSLRADLA